MVFQGILHDISGLAVDLRFHQVLSHRTAGSRDMPGIAFDVRKGDGIYFPMRTGETTVTTILHPPISTA
jgi:hypothetical protein